MVKFAKLGKKSSKQDDSGREEYDGKGSLKWSDDREYTGMLASGQPHGKGTMKWVR